MQFLLEPGVVYLNHGSFGACPREVHNEYQRLQRQLESQPTRFLQREFPDLLLAARVRLADYIGATAEELVFVSNPTYAVNEIARSLKLGSADEVLCSDQEYGACLNAWQFMSAKNGFRVVQQPISIPAASDEQMIEQFWSRVTDATRVIFLSHITSPTALTMPVRAICRRAAQRNILTVIDGAHAPGQIEIDVHDIGADFYVGTCHKWMCAPKGSGFLYARRELQSLMEPLVVGWGWGEEHRQINSGSDFLDAHQWLGTHDPAAYLSVPRAIEFQAEHDWPAVRTRCHELAVAAANRAARIPGVQRVHADAFFHQMSLVELTESCEVDELKTRLYNEYRVEVPVVSWKGRSFIRISIQAYNTQADVDQFVRALRSVLS